uniref:Uncharacterized protein n=1 Tax=Ditylenchus dipsaci TaxID=166011 RepID=A0A915E7I0_9BILA
MSTNVNKYTYITRGVIDFLFSTGQRHRIFGTSTSVYLYYFLMKEPYSMRSKSPVKQLSNVAEHEFEHHWSGRFGQKDKRPKEYAGGSKYQSGPHVHRHHNPRNRSPKHSGVPQRPPELAGHYGTAPSHYFTTDYKSPLQPYDEPYQRMQSYGGTMDHGPIPHSLHSPQSVRSTLPPFHSLAIKDSQQQHGSSSNGMLSPPRDQTNGVWPPPGHGLSNYGRNSSAEYLNTWNTTHSGPGSITAATTENAGLPSSNNYEPQQLNGTLLSTGTRPRSTSPRKAVKQVEDDQDLRKYRSRSPAKKKSSSRSITKTFDYLHAQCKMEGVQLLLWLRTHVSWSANTSCHMPTSLNEYTIIVSGMKHPPQTVQFQWFLECTIPCPMLKDITEDALETCMRLCKRFSAKGLEFRCAKFIQDHVAAVQPMMALCWLNWVFKHRFDRNTHDACLPVVARLPLTTLESHRQMMPEKILVDLLAMKLRTCYQQTVRVFHTIHHMDHFFVDMDRCPRCGRQREHGKVRIQANPCHKLIGCDRCLQELGCEIERKSQGEYQAFHQCEHGLWAFNEKTEDCQCQTPIHKANYLQAHTAHVVESSASDATTIRTTPSTTVPNPVHIHSSSQSLDKNANNS